MTGGRTLLLGAVGVLVAGVAPAQGEAHRTGAAAFGDWRSDAPGVWRRITVADLPPPGATASFGDPPETVTRPAGLKPKAAPGFSVEAFASGLHEPRLLRTAPNGDILVAESVSGRILVLRPGPDGARVGQTATFATGLDRPFGLAFYPEADPQWLYVGEAQRVVRFPYRVGDLKPRGPAQVVVPRLTGSAPGGHWTRDLAFTRDGGRLLVAVGSGSNLAEEMARKSPAAAAAWDRAHGLGAAWGPETDRAAILSFTPEGGDRKLYATGIRNCSGLARRPQSDEIFCVTNERDGLGDNLAPDYVTRVKPGAFYGWPWYYLGAHEDPRLRGARPDLAGRVTVPDVLLQPHSAPLQLAFYPPAAGAAAFPAEYRGDAFVALHGSWNRSQRTGYKVVRVKIKDGAPTGEYQDFLTGFVLSQEAVWGRPVGVTVARDGALLVSDDVGGVIWRVSRQAGRR